MSGSSCGSPIEIPKAGRPCTSMKPARLARERADRLAHDPPVDLADQAEEALGDIDERAGEHDPPVIVAKRSRTSSWAG